MVFGLQKGEKVSVDKDLICCVKKHQEGFVVVCIAGEKLHLWQKSKTKNQGHKTLFGGAGKQWGKSLKNVWHLCPYDGRDKMPIMEHPLSRKPDAPQFTLCHQPLTPQVSVSLASGKGGTILQKLGMPAPDQDMCRIHNDKTISQVMNPELRTRRGLYDRGYKVGSLINYSTVPKEPMKWLDECRFLSCVDVFTMKQNVLAYIKGLIP